MPWLNLPIVGHGHVICMGNLGGGEFFLKKILQNVRQRPTKVHFFHINKYVGEIVIMNDLEWPMFSYCVI